MNDSGCTRPVSVRNMRTDSVPFSQLPGQSRLFLDYQNDPTALRRFYPSSVRSPFDVSKRVDEVLSSQKVNRNELCESLLHINENLGATTEVIANIELLRDTRTVAVLTGQQTGLFTGPLYSIYKALTTIRMAECLRSKGVQAVPVFWMATEDHDLAEVSTTTVVDSSSSLLELGFKDEDLFDGVPVGAVRMNDSVTTAIDEMFAAFPVTEFSESLKKDLRETWFQGKTFGEAFGSFLTRFLGGFGLVIVDPLHKGLKRLASPIYVDAIRKCDELVEALRERDKELSTAGYHSQLLIEKDCFPLFWQADDGVRKSLRLSAEGLIRAKDRSASFTEDEFADIATNDPSRISPSAVLRPIVQDFLFPTLCYFGGSAEIAYFAQNSEAYRVLGRPVTTILHRQSFTVIEPKHARTLEKYGLSLTDLFEGEEAIDRRVIDEFIDPKTAELFASIGGNINTQLDRLGDALGGLDRTLAENLSTRRRKMNYHLSALQKKYYLRRAITEEVIDRRLKGSFNALLPAGQLQERVLNVVSFLDSYGPGFIDWVYDSIDLEDKGHRLIFI